MRNLQIERSEVWWKEKSEFMKKLTVQKYFTNYLIRSCSKENKYQTKLFVNKHDSSVAVRQKMQFNNGLLWRNIYIFK